jgi:hypothetical protein
MTAGIAVRPLGRTGLSVRRPFGDGARIDFADGVPDASRA